MDALETMLEYDIRDNVAICDEIINALNKLIMGDIKEWNGGTVSYLIKLNRKYAFIEEVYMIPVLNGMYNIEYFIKRMKEHRQSIGKH